MPTLTQTTPFAAFARLPGLLARVRRHYSRLDAAHETRARFASQAASTARDTGLPPEVALGESAYDPALPFFFQSGFGRGQDRLS